MTYWKIATGVLVSGLLATAMSASAQDAPTLDPEAEAGKVIFEESAGGVGCAMCHGLDATGDVGPYIIGMDSVAILEQLKNNGNMQFIDLSNEEVDQVSAYLRYLHDLEDH